MAELRGGTYVVPDRSDITYTQAIYILHGIGVLIGVLTSAFIVTSFLFGLPSIVAVVMNYIRRDRVRGTFLESHFRWQIRTFWFALLWVVVATLLSLPLMLVLVGFVTLPAALALVGIWVLYRVVRGWMRLSMRLAMYA